MGESAEKSEYNPDLNSSIPGGEAVLYARFFDVQEWTLFTESESLILGDPKRSSFITDFF